MALTESSLWLLAVEHLSYHGRVKVKSSRSPLAMFFRKLTALLCALGLVEAHKVPRNSSSDYAARNLATVQAIYNNTVGNISHSVPKFVIEEESCQHFHHRSTPTMLQSSSLKGVPYRISSMKRQLVG